MTYKNTFKHKTMYLSLETCGLPVLLIINEIPRASPQREASKSHMWWNVSFKL